MILQAQLKDFFRSLEFIFNIDEELWMKNILFICIFIVIGVLLVNMTIGYIGNTMLFEAIENNDYEKVEEIIKLGASVNRRKHFINLSSLIPTNYTPLIEACRNGNERIIRLLVESGADVNKADNWTGKTPLIMVLGMYNDQNRFSLAMYLIENGADIHMVQSGSNNNHAMVATPFSTALIIPKEADEKSIEEAEDFFLYLMQHNVDITIYGSLESTLTYASRYSSPFIVQYLIENGYCDINDYDDLGNTALIIATKYEKVDVLRVLIELGANKNLTDDTGKTAYDYAVETGNQEIIDLLS